jgi:hypothetical protein
MNEEQLMERIRWALIEEPPMLGRAEEDEARGRRLLLRRRRRATTGIVVTATLAVLAAPSWAGPGRDGNLHPAVVAGAGAAESPAPQSGSGPASAQDWLRDGYPFPQTRGQLFEVARDRLDPSGNHLVRGAGNIQALGSGSEVVGVGAKFGWHNPGEAGEGLVQVSISRNPTQAETEFRAYECPRCAWEKIPGTNDRVLVARPSDSGSRFGVLYRQPDGDVVSIVVDPLFGNNSLVSVAAMTVTLDDAYLFVTDPRLNFTEKDVLDERLRVGDTARQSVTTSLPESS